MTIMMQDAGRHTHVSCSCVNLHQEESGASDNEDLICAQNMAVKR